MNPSTSSRKPTSNMIASSSLSSKNVRTGTTVHSSSSANEQKSCLLALNEEESKIDTVHLASVEVEAGMGRKSKSEGCSGLKRGSSACQLAMMSSRSDCVDGMDQLIHPAAHASCIEGPVPLCAIWAVDVVRADIRLPAYSYDDLTVCDVTCCRSTGRNGTRLRARRSLHPVVRVCSRVRIPPLDDSQRRATGCEEPTDIRVSFDGVVYRFRRTRAD